MQMAELRTIASLWIGDRLSWLEQLCLKSFADAGHKTVLYSYSDISNVPEGVALADASKIFPAEPMLKHARTGSPAIHADLWRLNLLQQTSEIWVDADMYCYRPFEFPTDHIFGWEKENLVCNAVLGLPRDSEALGQLMEFLKDPYAIAPWLKPWQKRELLEEAEAGRPVHLTEQSWGFTGPAAVTHFLKATGEIRHAEPVDTFYPISFKDRNHMIRKRFNITERLSDQTRGVHFWARRMKPRLQEKENNVPMKGSFLRALMDKHNIDPIAAPIPAKVKREETAITAEVTSIIVQDITQKGHSVDRVCRNYLVDKAFVKTLLKKQAPHTTTRVKNEHLREGLLANYHHERHFLQTIHVAQSGTAKRPFIYMKCHKAACTTILATLINNQRLHMGQDTGLVEEAVIHKPPKQLMANGRRNLTTEHAVKAICSKEFFRFTVIREPIVRTISAYSDKILGGGKQKTALMKLLKRPVESNISLSEFLDIIANDEAVLDLDRHWRSQSKEISYGLVPYDFIGDVADIGTAITRVTQSCFDADRSEIQDTRVTLGHASSSTKYLKGLTQTDKRNLEKALEEDFDMYAEVRRSASH